MKPVWCSYDEIPYEQMWDDASYWLPRVLNGNKIRARFVYRGDNQTVRESDVADWNDGLENSEPDFSSAQSPTSSLHS